jgi:hypothetical protein
MFFRALRYHEQVVLTERQQGPMVRQQMPAIIFAAAERFCGYKIKEPGINVR